MFNSAELETVLEELINEPFMEITNGLPEYCFGQKTVCGSDYDEVIAWLQIDHVKTEILKSFNDDYMAIGRDFERWARSRGFKDCQILGGNDNTLLFEVSAFMK